MNLGLCFTNWGAIVEAGGFFRRVEGFAIEHLLTRLGLLVPLVYVLLFSFYALAFDHSLS
jgi:hypothetical protein